MTTTTEGSTERTFMVLGTLREDVDPSQLAALRSDEQAQLEVLRSEGRIGAHHVSPTRRATFVEILAADEAGVRDTMATLPFAQFFDADIYPTTPPDAAEVAHRRR